MSELAVMMVFQCKILAVTHFEHYVTLLGVNSNRIYTFGLNQSRQLGPQPRVIYGATRRMCQGLAVWTESMFMFSCIYDSYLGARKCYFYINFRDPTAKISDH